MLTKITLHGPLGASIGEEWNLAVKSVGEAMRAIEILSEHKLYSYLIEQDKKGFKYKVFINNDQFIADEPLSLDNIQGIANSELAMPRANLSSIDIVPVIEGADADTWAIVAGAILIVVGVILLVIPGFNVLGGAAIIAGLGLVAAGVTNLLSAPPDFEAFREVQGKGAISYLFNGPQNTTREGGPIPIGYGRMLIGSHVIAASYEISHVSANEKPISKNSDGGFRDFIQNNVFS